MDRQTQKIQRIIELRQKEVDTELSHLATTRREVVRAESDLTEVRVALQQALEERRQMSAAAMDVDLWRNQEEWLETLAVRQTRAANTLAAVKVQERRAVAKVSLAHKKKKQAEMLMERLQRAHQLEQARKERKQEDELGLRQIMRRRSEET